MGNKIKCRKASFWLEDEILYCEFNSKKSKNKFREDFIEDYLEAIATLSDGRYFPLLIDLRHLNDKHIFSVVKTFAKNPDLKSATLSKSFVIKSFFIQFKLIVMKIIQDPIIPNKVFRSYQKAIKYSLETNYIFNTY